VALNGLETKKKVASKKLKIIADDLIELYAAREQEVGYSVPRQIMTLPAGF